MSFENWARRASGLVIPRMGFERWKFLPCLDCCPDEGYPNRINGCDGCTDWAPGAFEVVIAGVTTGTCCNPCSMNGTYILERGPGGPAHGCISGASHWPWVCCWDYDLGGYFCGDNGPPTDTVVITISRGRILCAIKWSPDLDECPDSSPADSYATWHNLYDDPVDCDAISELGLGNPHSGAGDCNVTSSTCVISAL